MKITKKNTLAVVAYVFAAMFVMMGGMKFMAPAEMVENFVRWGYPAWFIYVVGAIEVGAGILLAIPVTRVVGALILEVTMLGAAGTHLVAGEYAQSIPALVLFAVVAAIVYANRKQIVYKLQTVTARFL